MEQLRNIYKNKTVLITGHTGFKGSWLSIWLHELGARVIGYGLDPYTNNDNFVCSELTSKIVDIRGDVRDSKKLQEVFDIYQPEYVFHLAAQPIVRISYTIPVETYETNVIGTINVLECIRKCRSSKVGVFITTDKCYENKEQWWGYKENDCLGGIDPYSSSKACAEIVINSWRQSYMNDKNYYEHGKAIASVRAGNVIGGGDWSQDRIIPDTIRALEKGESIQLRNPKAIRPWQHVLDPLYGYLLLGSKLTGQASEYAGAWNFGPYTDSVITVEEVVNKVLKRFNQGEIQIGTGDCVLHEAKILNLDNSKSIFQLGWKPRWNIATTIDKTCEWYMEYKGRDVYEMCREQIRAYDEYKRL